MSSRSKFTGVSSRITTLTVGDIAADKFNPKDDKFGMSSSVSKILQEIQSAHERPTESDYANTAISDLQKGFKTSTELFNFLKERVNLVIPYKVNTPDPTFTSPFKFVSDVIMQKVLYALVWGPRGGAKSYNAGIIQWINANRFNLYEGKTLGGSKDQSKMSYEAMMDLWDRAGQNSKEVLIDETQYATRTRWKSGSQISILTASQNSVRGPHPQSVVLDEVDVMKWDILEAALSQPMAKHGIPSSLLILSTYHNIGGTMARLLGDSIEIDEDGEVVDSKKKIAGYAQYKYSIWEILEPCVDYNCSTCPLSAVCPGKHMKDAVGYYKIDDFIKKMETLSEQTLNAEWFCKRPSRKGLILEKFNDSKNLVNLGYNPDLPVDLSIDFGFSVGHQYAIGVYQDVENYILSDGRVITGTVMIDEIYCIPKTNSEMMSRVKKYPWAKYPGQIKIVADSAEKAMINEWKAAGYKIKGVNKNAISVVGGLSKLVDVISPMVGPPKFYVNVKCRGFIHEKDNYKWSPTGKPIDEYNDSIDQARYRVVSRVLRKRMGKPYVS